MKVLNGEYTNEDGKTVLYTSCNPTINFWNMHNKTIFEGPTYLGNGYYDIGKIGAFSMINGGSKSQLPSYSCNIDADSIGKFCIIAEAVKIGLPSHSTTFISPHPMFRYDDKFKWTLNYQNFNNARDPEYDSKMNLKNKESYKKNLPIIGNDVWIGCNSIILNGVKIGDGAIIAAGSVVTKDVPAYSIVGGTPAKLIRYKFKEEDRKKLLEIKWWEYGPDILYGTTQNNISTCISEIEKRIDAGYPHMQYDQIEIL